jgi:hypothetical protein
MFLVVALTLAACSAPEPQTLEERALARWQHLIERDFESAWQYFAPGYKDAHPSQAFVTEMAERPIVYRDVSLIRTNCDGDRCEVTLDVTYQVPRGASGQGPSRISTTIRERWISLDQTWWFSG